MLGLLLALVLQLDVQTLRDRMELARERGWQPADVRDLAREITGAARAATSIGRFLGALGLAAELCQAAAPTEARTLRADALALLAQRACDTQRWSALVLSGFVPNFGALPREAWAEELEEYDQIVDELLGAKVSRRARAELESARAFARVKLDRHWDWLPAEQRREALAALAEVRARYGADRCPGASEETGETVGQRAERFAALLTQLAFGAVAPPTRGIDLAGEPIDLEDMRGNVVVLDFWTSFCQPCLQLVPAARELLAELDDDALTYIGVCGDQDRLSGQATAQRVGMPWRNLWDGPNGTNGPAATAWHVNAVGWPTIYVLDQAGRIRAKLYGKDEIEQRLAGIVRRLMER